MTAPRWERGRWNTSCVSPKAAGNRDVSIATRFVFRHPLLRITALSPKSHASTPSPRRISGRDNPEFKRFLAVRTRKNRELILVEGHKLLNEALRSCLAVDALAFDSRTVSVSPDLADVTQPVFFSDSLFRALSDLETPQGVIALVHRPRFETKGLSDPRAFVLILDGVQDPGNVGTLFRTAEAAGVTGVLLTEGCAEPFSPKALRASAGSAFRVPHVGGLSAKSLLALLPKTLPLIATAVEPQAPSLFGADLNLPLALALGSEGSGLDALITAATTRRLRVPQARPVESLNVAAAGAIALFEIARRAGILQA